MGTQPASALIHLLHHIVLPNFPFTVSPPLPRVLVLAVPWLLYLVFFVTCSAVPPPPVQHHIYYSGSHVTSIAYNWEVGDVYVTEVVQGRVIRYNGSGNVAEVWSVTDPPLYSPTSLAYDDSRARLWLTDSTTGRVVNVNTSSGERINDSSGLPLPLPSQLWESGLVSISSVPPYDLFIFDRYRGYTADVDPDQLSSYQWLSGPPPATRVNNVTSTFLAAAASVPDRVFVVDGVADCVWSLDSSTGNYTGVFALPDSVTNIQALDWTWCSDESNGCLWVLYQPNGSTPAQQTVIGVSVDDGTVKYRWTMEAMRGSEERQQQPQWRQNAGPNAHLAAPALRVLADGEYSDIFRVYTAEADLVGPGHVVVERSENGSLLRRYDSIPQQHDITGYPMHAFSALQADNVTCTLWLTDADNGGLLVRAAANGTILQSVVTPELFTSILIDVTHPSSSSLILLSTNHTDWQLWRFHPDSGDQFTQLDTAAVHSQFDSSSRCSGDDVSATVGGLAIDDGGQLLLSLTCADVVLLLDATGGWDNRFNTSGELTRPTMVTVPSFAHPDSHTAVVVVDQSGVDGQWHFKALSHNIGSILGDVRFEPPMSQPLALTWDAPSQSLWMADVAGLIFQVSPLTLQVIPGHIFQPLPAAYDMRSLSIDLAGTLYAADSASRRLIIMFVGAEGRRELPPPGCTCLSPPLSSSSSSHPSSLSSSSSSTGGVLPPAPTAALLSGMRVAIVIAGVALALAASAFIYYWARRRQFSAREEDECSDEEESDEEVEAPYVQYVETLESVSKTGYTVMDATLPYDELADTSNDGESDVGQRHPGLDTGKLMHIPDTSDSRYDAYVRLYEALNGPRARGESAAAAEPSPSPSSSRTSTPLPSSHQSAGPIFHLSSDSSGSSGSDSSSDRSSATRSASRPSAIASLSSSVIPHFVDRVTDLHILGEGVSGSVYCGYYRGMAVVVKLPKSREMSAAQWREWQAHLRLPPHPNLVSFVGSLVMEDTNYLVLRLVEQGSLASLLHSPTATVTAPWYTRPYAVMRAAADVTAALHHVHRHGLVHRDVSARNVLVDADGTFVLADLGLCQEADNYSSNMSGTAPAALMPATVPLRWCSPDYLSTMRFTGKSDVWALGVTLWEMTSGGRLPYAEVVEQRTLQHQLESGLAALRVDREWIEMYEEGDERDLAGRVVALIETCMTRDVKRRPDAHQLVAIVQQQMAEWKSEAGEAAERVEMQWVDEHAVSPAAISIISRAETGDLTHIAQRVPRPKRHRTK